MQVICATWEPSSVSYSLFFQTENLQEIARELTSSPKLAKKALHHPKRTSTLFTATKSSSFKLRSKSLDMRDELRASMTQSLRKSIANEPKIHTKSLTKPVSPKLRVDRRSRLKSRPLPPSSEELKMLLLEQTRQATKDRVQRAKKEFQRIKIKSTQPMKSVVRSTKQLTMPHTPKSNLVKRLGVKVCSIIGSSKEQEDAASSLFAKRLEEAAVLARNDMGVTEIQPFHFECESRAVARGLPEDTPSTAPTSGEAISKFFMNPRSQDVSDKACRGLTEGRAPVLRTDQRSKAHSHTLPPSAQEKEALEMEEINNHPFKAKPVDKRVIESFGDVGVRKVMVKAVTQFDLFDLRSDQRSAARKASFSQLENDLAQSFQFKALPMPTFHSDGSPTRVCGVKPAKVTIPQSPKLSGGRRASSAPAHKQLPHHSVIKQQKMAALEEYKKRLTRVVGGGVQITQPKEFHLQSSERGLMHKVQFEERIRREIEEEEAARDIKAAPMPSFANQFVVKPCEKELTDFHEFKLRSEYRHSQAEQKFNDELRLEEERLKQEFRALPLPKSTFAPGFVLEIEEHSLVVPQEILLESEQRALRRKDFDEKAALTRKLHDQAREIEQKLVDDKENRDIQKLRRMTVEDGGFKFTAKPVVTEDLFPNKTPKSMPLTEPKSPFLRTKLRARNSNIMDGADNTVTF